MTTKPLRLPPLKTPLPIKVTEPLLKTPSKLQIKITDEITTKPQLPRLLAPLKQTVLQQQPNINTQEPIIEPRSAAYIEIKQTKNLAPPDTGPIQLRPLKLGSIWYYYCRENHCLYDVPAAGTSDAPPKKIGLVNTDQTITWYDD